MGGCYYRGLHNYLSYFGGFLLKGSIRITVRGIMGVQYNDYQYYFGGFRFILKSLEAYYRGLNSNLYFFGGVPSYTYSILGPKTLP